MSIFSTSIIRYLTKTCHPSISWHAVLPILLASRDFGIPLLEAITSGIPTIGCTGSCLEEAGGPGGIYVNPDDAQSMAEAIVRTCTDEQLRQDMIKAGKTYALNFTDEKLACDLMNTYEKVIRGHLQKRVDAGDPNYV